jgi:hypothetical protein
MRCLPRDTRQASEPLLNLISKVCTTTDNLIGPRRQLFLDLVNGDHVSWPLGVENNRRPVVQFGKRFLDPGFCSVPQLCGPAVERYSAEYYRHSGPLH